MGEQEDCAEWVFARSVASVSSASSLASFSSFRCRERQADGLFNITGGAMSLLVGLTHKYELGGLALLSTVLPVRQYMNMVRTLLPPFSLPVSRHLRRRELNHLRSRH